MRCEQFVQRPRPFAGTDVELDAVLERYSRTIVAATHVAPRVDTGLFVMTAHQAKGKEFDAVVLAEVSARYFPDDDENRRLFYVAVTRATSSWTIIAPDAGAFPFVRHLARS